MSAMQDRSKQRQTAVGLWVLAAILILSAGAKLFRAMNSDTVSWGSLAFDVLLLGIAVVAFSRGRKLWKAMSEPI
jgi:hypothetical protein